MAQLSKMSHAASTDARVLTPPAASIMAEPENLHIVQAELPILHRYGLFDCKTQAADYLGDEETVRRFFAKPMPRA